MGRISGFFLVIALIALFDGLIAQMRAGNDDLEVLPGQIIMLSGPTPLKNPLNSDLEWQIQPATMSIKFELEEYFSGYWFGNAMWRGKISVSPYVETGIWILKITFKGAPAQSAQKFTIRAFENYAKLRDASFSFFIKWFNLNPFIFGGICGCLGLFAGIFTYIFGRSYAKNLMNIGLSQIYSGTAVSFCCLANRQMAPFAGAVRMVLDNNGKIAGNAAVEYWSKGKVWLKMTDSNELPVSGLVWLRPPENN